MKSFDIISYGKNADWDFSQSVDGVNLDLRHVEGDPEHVYRFYVKGDGLSVELIPSKGLSIRDVWFGNSPFFWDAPMEQLPDPKDVDLTAPLLIDGEQVEGMRWIAYFAAHVEMMGLRNWGIATKKDEEFYALHGNVSNIPIDTLHIEVYPEKIIVSGMFTTHDAHSCVIKDSGLYPEFEVTKRVEIDRTSPQIQVHDSVKNVSKKALYPDWGYHIQLRPQVEAELLIPSLQVRERFKSPVPENHERWYPAKVTSNREERGYIHKKLNIESLFEDGSSGFKTLLKYKDGTGIMCCLPPSPYTMSWFSCGGAEGENFMFPPENNQAPQPVLHKNWDGVGPEIGASALDHDGDVDPEIQQKKLEPGETQDLRITIALTDKPQSKQLEEEIRKYNKGRQLC